MITREEREKDRAICEAAPDSLAKMVDDVGRIDLVSENTSIFGYDPIAIGVGEAFADFAIVARDRLPLYIADAEEIERRIAHLDSLAAANDRAAERADGDGRVELLGKAAAYRHAASVLRGET